KIVPRREREAGGAETVECDVMPARRDRRRGKARAGKSSARRPSRLLRRVVVPGEKATVAGLRSAGRTRAPPTVVVGVDRPRALAWGRSSRAAPWGIRSRRNEAVRVRELAASRWPRFHCQPWAAPSVFGPGRALAPSGVGRVTSRSSAGSGAPLVTVKLIVA